MPVAIEIVDGVPPWLSRFVVPGTVSQGVDGRLNFSMVGSLNSDPAVSPGYGFEVTVDNQGNNAAVPFLFMKTGFFDGPAGRLGSPLGARGSRAQVVRIPATGLPATLELRESSNALLANLGSLKNVAHWGFSGNSAYLLMVSRNAATDPWQIEAWACTRELGSSVNGDFIRPAGAKIISGVTVPANFTTGIITATGAFAPNAEQVACLIFESTSEWYVVVLDLRALFPPQMANPPVQVLLQQRFAKADFRQPIFSPGGDMLAAFGTGPGKPIQLWAAALPSGSALAPLVPWAPFQAAQNGMPINGAIEAATISGLNIGGMGAGGFGAIACTGITNNGMAVTALDAPQAARCAVELRLWVLNLTASPLAANATLLPGMQRGDDPSFPPSAYIPRVNAMTLGGGSAKALVDARWRPTVANSNVTHWCAVAEAYTTPPTSPGDRKQRTSADINFAGRQLAQRNLVVI
jgi:hypothetical protein